MNHFFAMLSLLFTLLVSSVWATDPAFDLRSMKPPRTHLELEGDSVLVFTAEVDPGWHINADTTLDEFLLPSTIEIKAEGMTAGKARWPKAERIHSEALNADNLVFTGTFQVRIPVSLQGWALGKPVSAILHYQACSNAICLAPSQVTATLGVTQVSVEPKKNEPVSVSPTPENPLGNQSLLTLLFFAFVGGLILNLMPCVLPVLSIKALSLAKHAKEGRKRLLAIGGSMTLGIMSSFWILAAVVIIAKQAGQMAGWGFQFQNPWFVVGMLVLITLFAMNMFGVFEIWLPSSAQTGISKKASGKGYAGAFFNGVLMTLLSTPCSAPFLGAAMGYAFTQSAATLFLFFTVAGIGLATPYLLLSLFPATLKWIPKPGDWMIRFKQFLGFLLLATSAWLISVVGSSMGGSAQDMVMLILLVLAVGAWAVGQYAPPGVAFGRVLGLWGLTLAIAGGLMAWKLAPAMQEGSDNSTKSAECQDGLVKDAKGHYHWSKGVVETLRKQGYTVFVDYTADWCLTCKANEKAILQQEKVQKLLHEYNVAMVVADFTRPDADISESLRSFGRSGVPLYVVYPANTSAKAMPLPELLTPEIVVDALMQAGPSTAK